MRIQVFLTLCLLFVGCASTGAYKNGVPEYNINEMTHLSGGMTYEAVVSKYGYPTKRDTFSGGYEVAQYCTPISTKLVNFQAADVVVLKFRNNGLVGTSTYHIPNNSAGNFDHCRNVIYRVEERGVGNYAFVPSVQRVQRNVVIIGGGSSSSSTPSNPAPVIQPPVFSDQGEMFKSARDLLNR